jgi:hypothetical protein
MWRENGVVSEALTKKGGAARTAMPRDRCRVELPEPPNVAVAYLKANWMDDAGKKRRDEIHQLRLHGVAPAN